MLILCSIQLLLLKKYFLHQNYLVTESEGTGQSISFFVVVCYLTIISFITYVEYIVIFKRDYDFMEPVSSRVTINNHRKYSLNLTYLTIFDWITAAKIINEAQMANVSVALDISLENKYPILKKESPYKVMSTY